MADYWYCAAKIVNARIHGEVETEEAILGSEYHEAVASEIIGRLGPLKTVRVESLEDVMGLSRDNIDAALTKREVLANGEEETLFWSVIPELNVIGVPDKADCTKNHPVLMDFKTTMRLPGEAWVNHRIQIGTYMLGVERLGFRQEYGIVRYTLRSDANTFEDFKVYLDGYLRDQVVDTAREVHRLLHDGASPRPTTNPNKCRTCPYNMVCEWSLTRMPNSKLPN